MPRSFTVVVQKDVDGGFIASVAELPGCHTQGDSMEDLRRNVREAIALYIEDMADLLEFVGVETVEVEG